MDELANGGLGEGLGNLPLAAFGAELRELFLIALKHLGQAGFFLVRLLDGGIEFTFAKAAKGPRDTLDAPQAPGGIGDAAGEIFFTNSIGLEVRENRFEQGAVGLRIFFRHHHRMTGGTEFNGGQLCFSWAWHSLDVDRVSVAQNPEWILLSRAAEEQFQFSRRSVNGFVAELKSPVMDGNAGAGTKLMMGAPSFFRVHVDGGHYPSRAVSADGQKRETRVAETAADFREVIAHRGIAGKINGALNGLDDIAAPESFIAIGAAARGEMYRRHTVDLRASYFGGLIPIHFLRARNAVVFEKRADF